MTQIFQHGADVVGLDAALESLDAIDGNHRNAIAVALEDRRIASDIHLVEGEVIVGGEVFQVRPRVIAEMTASFGVEHDRRFHGCFLRSAYRSDSGMERSRRMIA